VSASVPEICSGELESVQPDEPLDVALQEMAREAGAGRPPVTVNGRLVGIVAQADVVRAARSPRRVSG